MIVQTIKIIQTWGSGCGTVGRAVASDTRGPRFESCHRQNLVESYKRIIGAEKWLKNVHKRIEHNSESRTERQNIVQKYGQIIVDN